MQGAGLNGSGDVKIEKVDDDDTVPDHDEELTEEDVIRSVLCSSIRWPCETLKESKYSTFPRDNFSEALADGG